MKTIGDLLARDLGHDIEEIIKVDQTDEESVYSEITEYVATASIKDYYRELLKAIADAPSEPTEGIGVWISGFFGSGKSSFAKNLGYVLSNPTVLGTRASTLFKNQVNDRRIGELVDFINTRFPTEVVMFDVSVDRAVRDTTQRIAEIMYTVLLRQLDYAQDFDIADLEIELEGEGRFDEFTRRCFEMYAVQWNMVRKGAQKFVRASAILHAMDDKTNVTADTWAASIQGRPADITVGKFVERTFDLCARRRPGRAMVFVIDEVGQYVARSADKIEDLRAVVEQFGKAGKNLLKDGKVIAPVWVVVTSQEKLEEVVAAIDSKRVDLAKLQDRFKHRVDLAPADIREVASRRVLAKRDAAAPVLRDLFSNVQGQLNAATHLERTSRHSDVSEDDFVQFYPYLPHYVELSIDITSGIRLQPGAPKQYGGSNRTIIKQAYEMLVSPRTALARQPVGTLVTLDKVYELVEGNLPTEKQKDISDIATRFKGSLDQVIALRVAKTVCLLEFVSDLPRTEANIAACLVDDVTTAAPRDAVSAVLQRLQDAQFVRNTDEGWKLQTAQEKNWETERRSYLAPKPRDRNEITRTAIQDIFGDPKLKTYRYKNIKTFSVGVSLDRIRIGDEGAVSLAIHSSDDAAGFPSKLAEIRDESRQDTHKNDVYWVMALTPEIDDLVANLFASKEMVKKYEQVRAQNRITPDESSSLAAEKAEATRLQGRLRDKLTAAFEEGKGIFRGISNDASSLGKNIGEISRKVFDDAVPNLYPKLEMGARSLKGTEADEILKAANLNGLSQVFYDGVQGLGLVVKDGPNYTVDVTADIAKEILDYLVKEQANGERETRTGKALESNFGGLGYGWERDMLRLVLATLFRAGAIDVRFDGKTFDSYREAGGRVAFTNNTIFRSALFTSAKRVDLKTLTRAVESYETLTGKTVDVEKAAIGTALKIFSDAEFQLVTEVQAVAQANHLPFLTRIDDYQTTLSRIQKGSADECVRTLADEGKSLKEERDQIYRLHDVLSKDQELAAIHLGGVAVTEMWPILQARVAAGELASTVTELTTLLSSDSFYDSMSDLKAKTKEITTAYHKVYSSIHTRRADLYGEAHDSIKGDPQWLEVPPDLQAPVLASLVSRSCQELDLSQSDMTCAKCHATVGQMESDEVAVDGLRTKAITRVREITTPTDNGAAKTVKAHERVRVTEFFLQPLDTEDAINDAVEKLRERLLGLLKAGARIEVA